MKLESGRRPLDQAQFDGAHRHALLVLDDEASATPLAAESRRVISLGLPR